MIDNDLIGDDAPSARVRLSRCWRCPVARWGRGPRPLLTRVSPRLDVCRVPGGEQARELARTWLETTDQGRWRLAPQTRAALCVLGGDSAPWETLIASSFARTGRRLRRQG
ncbi:hypothetical protein [Marichromatium bheemlicum]|uniref:Uncharacterized protein n=1 Tax=Marichromatium bheemlicum TaxID=365339 RepID=A0ABX1I4V6_9GAMM|nr:hypothetical protein [Marichromatium bheemlicum]NKN32039.1 hypothetical protein [Marichromatium bheemlicum]